MIKFLCKSLLLCVLLAFISFVLFAVTNAFLQAMNMNFTAIILIVGVAVGMVWIFTKLLMWIARSISFMYWLFCVGLSVATFILSLSCGSFFELFTIHMVGLMFFIPELNGEYTIYLNTETYYDGYGEVVNQNAWLSENYTSGCVKKLVAMAILATVFSLLEMSSGGSFIRIVFVLELIYSGALTFINAKHFFFS